MPGLNRNITLLEGKIAISILLILIITFTAFLPSLENGFVNLDDPAYVIKNDLITDLSLRGIKNIFTSFHRGLYKPLVFLSFAIEYHFFALNPFIYHATNLILHLSNCLLVFWLIFLISDNLGVSFITAILFGIHPLHVESVAWVTERKDVLYSFFFLAAAVFYIYFRKSNAKKYYALSLAAFILSLLTKPMGLTLPFVLLLIDFMQKRKFDKKALAEKALFFIMFLVVLCVDAYSYRLPIETGIMPVYVSFESFLIAARGIVFYLKQLFFPLMLSCMYPYPDKIAGSLPPEFIFSPAIVAFLAVMIILASKRNRKVSFGGLFFLVTISPVLQLIPSGPAIAADRYVYIPSLGFFYIIGECFSWIYQNNFKYKIFTRGVLIIIFIASVITLSFLTFKRTKIWRNSLILWDDAVKKIPRNIVAYVNRGGAYAELGKFAQAISDCNKAIELNPSFAKAYYHRAVVYFFKQEYDKSWADVRKARALGFRVGLEFLGGLEKASGEKY